MGCDTPESRAATSDFCAAFKTSQEYYDKIWMLTPDDLKTDQYANRGDNLIVQQKEMWFANPDVTATYKYQGDKFVAYRRDFKPDPSGKKSMTSELVIFHQKITPNAIGIGSLVDNNDELFNQMLSTIE